MLVTLLLVCGAAAFSSIKDLPKEVGGYTISRLGRTGRASKKATPLVITDNVVTLERATSGTSLSSRYVEAIRNADNPDLELEKRATNGTTALQVVAGGAVFLAKITVGGQTFSMVIDTGSSDPWLVTADFQCYSLDDDTTPVAQSACYFGPTYTKSATYSTVPNENFNITYADGEYLSGPMGYETFSMAGIVVTNQQFGLVNQAAWQGDLYSSGLCGFAYRTLTSAHAGSDSTKDKLGDTINYNPLFVNMYTNSGVPPVFSMAIDRDASKGGVMALGGIPNIPHAPYYVSTPIEPIGINSAGALVYEFYTIEVNGYAVSNSPSTMFNPYSNVNALKTPLLAPNTTAIVDSGTSLCYLQPAVVSALAAAYSPPATLSGGWYVVDCAATAPVFGVAIAGKVFYVNPADLIIQYDQNTCVAGIQSAGVNGLIILGGTWMKNVIAVFDIGAEMMQFAAREYYSTS